MKKKAKTKKQVWTATDLKSPLRRACVSRTWLAERAGVPESTLRYHEAAGFEAQVTPQLLKPLSDTLDAIADELKTLKKNWKNNYAKQRAEAGEQD